MYFIWNMLSFHPRINPPNRYYMKIVSTIHLLHKTKHLLHLLHFTTVYYTYYNKTQEENSKNGT